MGGMLRVRVGMRRWRARAVVSGGGKVGMLIGEVVG